MKPSWLLCLAAALFLRTGEIPVAAQTPAETSIWKVEIEPDTSEPGKFKVRGTVFGIGDPVHETLTLHALINGGMVNAGTGRTDDAVVQYIRGVFWNDDPCAQLFTENDFIPLEPSYGVVWYTDFRKAKKKTSQQAGFADLSCRILGRSHFGDLQFFHGMADRNGAKASETQAQLLAWASVAYRVATGAIDAQSPLRADATAQTLPLAIGDWSAMRLFRAKTMAETRARALGSLLHVIQDSYARGHVARVAAGSANAGAVTQFLSYVDQDEKKHAHDDSWGSGGTDLAKTLAIPGSKEALAASTEIVRRFKAGEAWASVEQYLKVGPLFVVPDAKDSGPGDYQ